MQNATKTDTAMIQPRYKRQHIYKTKRERLYTEDARQLAYEDYKHRLMAASIHPSAENVSNATLVKVAKDHKIGYSALNLYRHRITEDAAQGYSFR